MSGLLQRLLRITVGIMEGIKALLLAGAGPIKTARLKAEKEERAKMKAEKELQQMKSERRQQPEIMWKRLIEESGKEFEDVIFKKPVEYNF